MTFVQLRRVGAGVVVEGEAEHDAGTVIDRRTGNGVHVRWHADEDGLSVTNDPLGFWPVFYRELPDGIVVGDEIDDLLEVGGPTRLDLEMAGVLLAFGQLIGDATLFEGIRALPPNSWLRWGHDGLEISKARADPEADGPPATRADAVDAYIDLFRAAVGRRLGTPGRVGVGLSGGEDSRHIVLELARQDAAPDLVVTAATPWGDPDLRAARDVAGRLGLAHVVTPHGLGGVALERRNNRLTSYCASELAWMLPTVDWMTENIDATHDGIGGDVLSAGLYLTKRRVQLARKGAWLDLADDLTGGERDARLRDLFVPRAVRGQLPDRHETLRLIADGLAEHADAPNPVGSWMFATRTRRQISMQPHALMADLVVQTPYLDLDLVRFLRSLPDAWLVDHRFHADTIRRAFPGIADIPFEKQLAAGWGERRRAVHRRASALRLLVEARDVWDSPLASRLRATVDTRFKSFKEARRAITVHHAAAASGSLAV